MTGHIAYRPFNRLPVKYPVPFSNSDKFACWTNLLFQAFKQV